MRTYIHADFLRPEAMPVPRHLSIVKRVFSSRQTQPIDFYFCLYICICLSRLEESTLATTNQSVAQIRTMPSIFSRKRDLAYLIFFAIHIPIVLCTALLTAVLFLCIPQAFR